MSEIRVENIDLVMADLQKIAGTIRNPKTRRAVLQTAGKVVANAAQNIAPQGTPRKRDTKLKRENNPIKLKPNIKYTYKAGLQRAGKGKGNITGQYALGNLKLSMQVITKIKAPIGLIGPIRNKKTKIIRPSERNSNGWYAAMVFGSAKAFGNRITQKALLMKQSEVYRIISNRIIEVMNKSKKNTSIR